MTHPNRVIGWTGTLHELVQAIGNMRYDTQAEFVGLLATELKQQAAGDEAAGRRVLSARLRVTADDLDRVRLDLAAAWKICEPHMPD